MSQLAYIVLDGVVSGMILVLVALGLAIIFGMLEVINFAHGALYMLGAYVTVFVVGLHDGVVGFVLAMIVVSVVLFLVGCGMHFGIDSPERMVYAFVVVVAVFAWDLAGVVEAGVVAVVLGVGAAVALSTGFVDRSRSLYERGHLPQVMFTFGIALLIQGSIEIIAGPKWRTLEIPPALAGTVGILGTSYPIYRLFVILLTAVLAGSVIGVIRSTSYGQVIRAGVTDPEMVRLLGIDLDRVFLVTFGLGATLAGLSGVLAAPIRPVEPFMGASVLIQAFVVIIVGGIGSIKNIIYAGLLIGLLTSVIGTYFPPGSNVAVYLFMALVLVVRPEGLFASGEVSA